MASDRPFLPAETPIPSPPSPLGSRLDRLWSFDPTYVFLNHNCTITRCV